MKGLYGGQLYLLRYGGEPRQLTSGPYYNKKGAPEEVYSDPDFSPDERRVVFSVHGQPGGDLIEASGPYAIADLTTGEVAILSDTLLVPGEQWGTGFAAGALWSPDGSKLLLNFEDGSSLTDAGGKHLQDLAPLMNAGGWASSLGWLGTQCVVYTGGKDYIDSGSHPARFLNLVTKQSGELSSLLRLKPAQVTGLLAVTGTLRVRRQGHQLIVDSGDHEWSINDPERRVVARVLPATDSGVPDQCR